MNEQVEKMINEKKSRNAKTKNYIINVNCYTWINNSHGLFDYESENFYKKCFKIKCLYNYYYILKDDINVEIKNEEEINKVVLKKTNLKLICKIKYMNNSYQLIPCIDNIYEDTNNVTNGNTKNDTKNDVIISGNSTNNNNENNNDRSNNSVNVEPRLGETNETPTENDMDNFWVIVKYLKNKSSVLHEDDVLKLGRVKLKIKKIITNAQQEREYNKSIAPFDEAECETVAPETEHYIARHLTDERNIMRANLLNIINEHVHENNNNNNNTDNNNFNNNNNNFNNNNNNFNNNNNNVNNNNNNNSINKNDNNLRHINANNINSVSINRNICFNYNVINENNNGNNTISVNPNNFLAFPNIKINSPVEENNLKEEKHKNNEEIKHENNGNNNGNNNEKNTNKNFCPNDTFLLSVNGTPRGELHTYGNQGETNFMFTNETKNIQNIEGNSRNVEKEKVNSHFTFTDNTNRNDHVNSIHDNVNSCNISQTCFNDSVKGVLSEKDIDLNKTRNTDLLQNDEQSGRGDTNGDGIFYFNYFSSSGWDRMSCLESSMEFASSKDENKKEVIQQRKLSDNCISKNPAEEKKNETSTNLEVLKESVNAFNEIRTVRIKEEDENLKNYFALTEKNVQRIYVEAMAKDVEIKNEKNKNTLEKEGKCEQNRYKVENGDIVNKKNNYNKKRNNCENEIFEKFENGNISIHSKENFMKFRKSYSVSSMSNCRICLCEYEDASNPLISPCKCKGSMKYVHLNCLRTWMRGRLNVRSDSPSISFFWKQLNCELCKHPYPTYINVQNKHLELYEIPKPKMPYIIIELMNDRYKGFYIVSLASTKFVRMGRGHDSDVRVNDISVSRFHAMIKFQNGKFYIEDCKSKFGTLIQIRKPVFFNIRKNKFIALQIGRTVMYVYMKRKNWIFLPVCLKLSKTQDEDVSMLDNFSSKLLIDNNVHLSNNNFEYDRMNNELANYENVREVLPVRYIEGNAINENISGIPNESSVIENNRLENSNNGINQLRNIPETSENIHFEDLVEGGSNVHRRDNLEEHAENCQVLNTASSNVRPDVRSFCTGGRNIDLNKDIHENRNGNEANVVANRYD